VVDGLALVPKKQEPPSLPLKGYASEVEHCSVVIDGVLVLERLREAVRASSRPQKLASNIGHFADWLSEVRARQTIDAATHARALDVLGALGAASSDVPSPEETARLRVVLDDLLARNPLTSG